MHRSARATLVSLAMAAAGLAPAVAHAQVGAPPAGAGCGEGRSPIMILGMYHMANPGLDAVNTEADDVLLPRRQKEIQELVNRLVEFRPTKIAVEAPYRSTAVPDRYRQYVAGTYALSRNETEQIGFRLAKQLGLPGVTPIDFPMFMSGQVSTELDLTPAPDTSKATAPAVPARPRELTAKERLLRESTVSGYLAILHSDSAMRADHAVYLQSIRKRSAPAIYERTDQLTNWYKRNLRMLTNLNREVEHGKDRVLVLVGSGHLTILRQLASGASYYCLVEPAPYLK
jgi:hypothetical protein